MVHWNTTWKLSWNCPHRNATGETLTVFAYTRTPLEKLSWSCPTLGCTGEILTCVAYTGTRLDELWQTPHTQAHIVKQSSTHASLKLQDGGTANSKWTGLCKFSFYSEFTALQCIPVLLLRYMSTLTSFCACFWYKHNYEVRSDLTQWPPNQILSVQWDTTGKNTLEDHSSHKYTVMPLEPRWLMLAPSGVPMAIQC